MNAPGMLVRSVLGAFAAALLFLSGAWGALALWYRLPGNTTARAVGSTAWVLLVISLFTLALLHHKVWPLAGHALALLLLTIWWTTIRPSHHRLWADDVAHLLRGSVQGSEVTLEGVRNFAWRSDDDYDVRWETRGYQLDHLIGADAILCYWGRAAIAHAMISFGFDDGRHLVFSVEVRKRRGEGFSELGGFFKQFEMILVAADERDIVRVRTNVRGENVYLYPLTVAPATLRELFLSYVAAAAALQRTPTFYNTISANCASLVYRMARQLHPGLPLDLRLLLTGYLPGYLYDNGALDHRYTLEQWRRRAFITERARRGGPDEDFSRLIRAGDDDALTPQTGPSP